MSTTGKSWQIGTYVDTTPADLGMLVFDANIQRHSTTTKEPGTSQRRLASIDTSHVYYTIDVKGKVQDFTFLNTNAFVTAEGALPRFNLYTYDGVTKKGFTDCQVNTCSIDIKQTGAVVASMQIVAIATEDKDFTITSSTAAPLTKADLSALSIGGTSILTKFTDVNFSVNNNVTVTSTGNGVAATEVHEKHVEYSGSLKFTKSAALTYGYSTDEVKDLIITLDSVTYTFDDVRASSNSYTVQELDLTYESISFDGDELAIT